MTCPPSLRHERRWVLWRYAPNPNNPAKPRKVNLSLTTGEPVDRFDEAHWQTFYQAANYAGPVKHDGIGFVLGGGYVGYDRDNCFVNGALTPEARAVVAELDSYTEATPSGKGIHVILRGALPSHGRRKGPHELYDNQFFTFTGCHVDGTPDDVLGLEFTKLPIQEIP